ncbi:hypothetical protein AGLY_006778 [Aphis glycines]|uniref:Uncharacterized protein n=1 Tax=Aphis glycines TaxID=307491 RepID=A0A6G0TSJ4_APHGL|nr:hypothetical protein AGLY_006778 [Aphis glycines]
MSGLSKIIYIILSLANSKMTLQILFFFFFCESSSSSSSVFKSVDKSSSSPSSPISMFSSMNSSLTSSTDNNSSSITSNSNVVLVTNCIGTKYTKYTSHSGGTSSIRAGILTHKVDIILGLILNIILTTIQIKQKNQKSCSDVVCTCELSRSLGFNQLLDHTLSLEFHQLKTYDLMTFFKGILIIIPIVELQSIIKKNLIQCANLKKKSNLKRQLIFVSYGQSDYISQYIINTLPRSEITLIL